MRKSRYSEEHIFGLLRREGFAMNHKWLYRLSSHLFSFRGGCAIQGETISSPGKQLR